MIKLLIILTTILYSYFDEYEKISDYNIYKGDPHNLETSEKFTTYELITPLFTDYAWKHRAIYIPVGKSANYNSETVFDFPVGTIISKTFYYPRKFNDLNSEISLSHCLY